MKQTDPLNLALAAVHKHLEIHGSFDHYTGIVTLHGLTRLAVQTGQKQILDEARSQLAPYVKGERTFRCNFPNYQCGGNASAYLLWQGKLPEAEAPVRHYAEEIMQAPRDPEGILRFPSRPEKNQVWIDVAFAVCPFMLFAGLALQESSWVEESFQQAAKMFALFRDPENGLLHQSKNFSGPLPDGISEDHWSRGNGWGIYAAVELACHLPEAHPRKAESVALFTQLIDACAAVQDQNGLWHQELTRDDSYVETSGSGLILYAIGAGLEAGLLDEDTWRPRLLKGLRALLPYITSETDIHHTCRGCLCPGQGTILDYMARNAVINDPHAFGPIVLCMGQAAQLGITTLTRPDSGEPT